MPGFELALVQWLVLRHELPDPHFFDHRIIARNELIARVSGCPVAHRFAVSPAAAFYRASGLVLDPLLTSAVRLIPAPCQSQLLQQR
jgi:hypothetical protein